MSSQEAKDVLWKTVSYYIRVEYYNKSGVFVPQAMCHLITKFSESIIKSDILSIKADVSLVSKFKRLIPGFNNQTAFTRLFKASEHEYRASKFHKAVDYKKKTITIIKSNFGAIFGGYATAAFEPIITSPGLQFLGLPIRDSTVFLFAIDEEARDEAKIFNKARRALAGHHSYGQDRRCISYDPKNGPAFGLHDIKIIDKCNEPAFLGGGGGRSVGIFKTSHCGTMIFDTGEGADRTILCGSLDGADKSVKEAHDKLYGNDVKWEEHRMQSGMDIYINFFTVLEYEVFQLHDIMKK